MKKLILFLILNCLAIEYIIGQNSFLQKQGTATQLVVHGMPFLILGGELGNSSAACPQDIERIFPKLKKMGLNTVLVPVYWDLTKHCNKHERMISKLFFYGSVPGKIQ